MRILRAIPSAVLLVAIFAACEYAVRRFHLPLPGGVLGAVALAVGLFTGFVPLRWVERGADVLLEWLGLFFVPAGVGILRHVGVLKRDFSSVVVVVVVSTAVTMIVTGRLAERRNG
ncbi:MAG: CidA/LrgA family protein [Myxococcales bacterium]|nr:CidA/LrgA family protein [Myxococcales bacterium]